MYITPFTQKKPVQQPISHFSIQEGRLERIYSHFIRTTSTACFAIKTSNEHDAHFRNATNELFEPCSKENQYETKQNQY